MTQPEASPLRTTRLATASAVLGLVGLGCFGPLAGIPAVILGAFALGKIRKSHDGLGGSGLAVGGLVMGCVSVVAMVAGFFILAVQHTGHHGRLDDCKNNLAQLSRCVTAYSDRFNGYLPHDQRGPLYSLSLLYPGYADDRYMFVCPSAPLSSATFPPGCSLAGLPCSYGYDNETNPRTLRPDSPIMADMPNNHGNDEERRINVLLFSGKVKTRKYRPAHLAAEDEIFRADPGKPPDEDTYIRR